jgi:glycosyltransferase involved in cell wall biosynthesis
MKSLSVVICAYNEEANVQNVLAETLKVLQAYANYEVIIVDDGSTDQTLQVIKTAASKDAHVRLVVHEKNEGMGKALLHGFQAAQKEWVTFLPADGQISPADINAFIEQMPGYDMVVSYYTRRKSSLFRSITSAGIRFLYFVCFGPLPKFDGTYMFEKKMLANIPLKMSDSFFINYEFVIRAKRAGYKIKSIPTVCLERMSGHSKVTGMRKIMVVFTEIIKFRFKYY